MAQKKSENSLSVYPLTMKANGQFLITDYFKKIIAISENLLPLGIDAKLIISTDLELFLENRFTLSPELSSLLSDPSKICDSGRTFVVKEEDVPYYLHIHKQANQLFIRIEEKISDIIFSSEMNDFTPIDNETLSSIWCKLLENIQGVTEADNVLVAQIMEDKTSRVIATTDHEFAYTDKLFSKSFISEDLYAYFSKNEVMYIPDLARRQQIIFCAHPDQNIPIEYLPLSQKARFSNLISAKSTFTIPILINKCLWGLVVCINKTLKKIDYQKRLLCQLLVQNASVRHEEILQKKGIEFDKIIQQTKKQFDDNLSNGRSLNYCLLQHIDEIANLAKADGVAIYHHGVIHKFENTPSNLQIDKILDTIKQVNKKIFKDNNFRLKRKHDFTSPLPIAGVAALQVGGEKDHWILWFRDESKTSLMEVCDSREDDEQGNSEGNLQLMETEIVDTAAFWNDEDLSFIRSLDKMITKAIIARTKHEEQTKEMLITANNELEMITHTISHDLKNPLSAVRLSTQLLQKKMDMSQDIQNLCISNIVAGLENMESLINKTVAFMRSKHVIFKKEEIAIHPLIPNLFEESKKQNNNSRCELEIFDLMPIYGEKATIRQIFSNIIDNAVKFSTAKGNARISLSSYKKDKMVVYKITDNGIGIPEDELNLVMNAFYKGKNALGYPGAGIGLALVNQLVNMLGGSIEIESKINTSTTLIIAFPDN